MHSTVSRTRNPRTQRTMKFSSFRIQKRKRILFPTRRSPKAQQSRSQHRISSELPPLPESHNPLPTFNLPIRERLDDTPRKLEIIMEVDSPSDSPSPLYRATESSEATSEPVSLIFQYYLPHLSTNTTDLYTDSGWVPSEMWNITGQIGTEESDIDDFEYWDRYHCELPLIRQNDFNYYPQTKKRRNLLKKLFKRLKLTSR